jgi:hypothetical protein
MTSGFPPSRLRGFHLPVRRLAAGAAANGTVDVVVKGDAAYETNETLSLTLGNPSDAVIGRWRSGHDHERRQGTHDGHPSNREETTNPVGERAPGARHVRRSRHRDAPAETEREIRTDRREEGSGSLFQGPRRRRQDGRLIHGDVRPPGAGGTYKILLRFNGTKTKKPYTRADVFKIPPAS